ncbi:MAG: YvcK family protein [Desulfobulbaceae bacterium]|nr:YvcK family protein [Desulfobulbaceae bacterium]
MNYNDPVSSSLKRLTQTKLDPLDLIYRRNLVEKLIELVLVGPPQCTPSVGAYLDDVISVLCGVDTSEVRVAVFGGGSGLSNVIGGDSRNKSWPADPFKGLKEIFPQSRSIVCVTDDGGSTGELLKDLPMIALGDIRHVLLSSIRKTNLCETYQLNSKECLDTVSILHRIINFRFTERPKSLKDLRTQGVSLEGLPVALREMLGQLLESLFADLRLLQLLERPHCLGNLLLVAAIFRRIKKGVSVSADDLLAGINWLGRLIGVEEGAVLPCTTTPAHLKVRYSNGVIVSGENKTATARRGTAVDRVFVEFANEPYVPEQVFDAISSADIIIFAPGSLYTSIIPILQVPRIAQTVRDNSHALKILVANLWIQKGETDIVVEEARRRFYVSDLIEAYHRNIPGGVENLFEQVMLLGLQDIPGNILQSYAVEDKVPIYLDRGKVWKMGFAPVEARIFSENALRDRRVQHDPHMLAKAVKTIWAARDHIPREVRGDRPPAYRVTHTRREDRLTPDRRRQDFERLLKGWDFDRALKNDLSEIFWRHWDIRQEHLTCVSGVRLIKINEWQRSLKWDRLYSFYDPLDGLIKIREDATKDPVLFEGAFLVALGQSLLGNYAKNKEIIPVEKDGIQLGKIYQITLEPVATRQCFFTPEELGHYLRLARMNQTADKEKLVFSRLISGTEGFTPPGMLMGLVYAWYLDSRYASNIEYKMAITRIPMSGLIREQVIMLNRRMDTIDFFRKIVFRHSSPVFDEQLIMQN